MARVEPPTLNPEQRSRRYITIPKAPVRSIVDGVAAHRWYTAIMDAEMAQPLAAVLRLSRELVEAVDDDGDHIGGHRALQQILRELETAVDKVEGR